MVGKKKLNDPASVTVTTRAGLAVKTDYSEKRGIVTTRQGTAEQKSYYYRAPGQKYDGKLRRTEENGKLTQEYRYDRKTGLLSEIIDAKGISNFFDYDPGYRPSARDTTEPKPIRVRRGTRRKSEIIAEYAYSPDGKLLLRCLWCCGCGPDLWVMIRFRRRCGRRFWHFWWLGFSARRWRNGGCGFCRWQLVCFWLAMRYGTRGRSTGRV